VFVASSAGKAIHFPTEDVRSQGRRATGVRAIQLDAGARVVGAFATEGVDWVALATEQGMMKRMPITEYRPQGRSGGGLQTYRVTDDPVASVAALPIDGDVVVLTNRGRVTRFPAFDLPLGNRAAKGEPCVQLEPGETVEQLLGVPAGSAS
jgi:DNA gyrase subunit A